MMKYRLLTGLLFALIVVGHSVLAGAIYDNSGSYKGQVDSAQPQAGLLLLP